MKKFIALLSPIALLLPLLFVPNSVKQAVATPDSGIPLEAGEEFDYENQVIDNFDNGIDSDNWYLYYKTWGQNESGRNNGGVTYENVFYDSTEGTAILRSTGDYYAENIIKPAPNAYAESGRRTGADLVSKFLTYPGRYEVRMRVTPRYGACTSMWTYIEYGDSIPGVGRNNHEIDIELPWHGDFNQVSFGNYVGLNEETQHTSVKYQSLAPLNDGEYHVYGFDWYYNENTNHKLINYYIDGSLCTTITQYIPFYKTKVNIGVWIPNSNLAGQLPLFDQAFMDVDYFKYIPFKNNVHMDSTYENAYVISSAAGDDKYPTVSTTIPLSQRNYFPNGTFDYVYKRNSSTWHSAEKTGITFTDATVTKQTNDYAGSANSGGVALTANTGSIEATIDSCHYGATYNLRGNYKNSGTAIVSFYNKNDELITTQEINLSNSANWSDFSETIEMERNTSYIAVSFEAGSSGLILDNIYLTLGVYSPTPQPETGSSNHFMATFHNNPSVLSTFNTTAGATSSRIEDVTIEDADYTSDIAWKSNSARYEIRNGNYCATLTMGAYGHNTTIAGSSDPDYSGIYNAVSSSISVFGFQSTIFSTTCIENITDLSFSWSVCETGTISVVYKIKDSANWQFLTSFDVTNPGIGTSNSDSFNRYQIYLDRSNSDFFNNLYNTTAQIGFMHSTNSTNNEVNYCRITEIFVNKIKSIKAKINYWNEHSSNLCDTSGSLFDNKSTDFCDLYFTNYNLSVAQANELNTPVVINEVEQSITYYEQFAYLCDIAGIQVTVQPSMYGIKSLFKNEDYSLIVLIILIFAIVGLTSVLVIRKQKHE